MIHFEDSSSNTDDDLYWGENPTHVLKLVGMETTEAEDWNDDFDFSSDSTDFDMAKAFHTAQKKGKEASPLRSSMAPPKMPSFTESGSDDHEDWDLMFQMTKNSNQNDVDTSTGSAVNKPKIDTSNHEKCQDIKSKYTLIPEERQIKKVTYPPPSHLFSLERKDGTKFFSSEGLYKWLKNIFTRNTYAITVNNMDIVDHKKKNKRDLKNITNRFQISDEWLSIFIDTIYPLYLKREPIWKDVIVFAKEMKTMNPPKEKSHNMIDSFLFVLHILSVQWNNQIELLYNSMFDMIKKTIPEYSLYIDTIKAETYSHFANKEHSPVDIFYSVYKECSKFLSSSESLPIRMAQANALASIQLIVNGYSPLNCNLSKNYELYDCVDRINDTVIKHDDERKDRLLEIYHSLPPSYIKAKVGISIVIGGDMDENLLFETVYMLDELCPIQGSEGISILLSELGHTALSYYADSLLENGKYKFSMQVYEAVLDIYSVTEQVSAFNILIQSIAKIATDHGDIARSVDFYDAIHSKYKEQKKQIEMNHVSLILSKLYLNLGNFPRAITVLDDASVLHEVEHAKFNSPLIKSEKLKTPFIELQLEISKCYLLSYNYEKATKILEKLLCFQLPKNYHFTVIELLIKGYIKKRWFGDAKVLLESIRTEGEEKKDINLFVSYLYLSSKNYCNAQLYADAIYCIDKAIILTSTERARTLAKLYRHRGKVLRKILSDKTIVYPLTLDSVVVLDSSQYKLDPSYCISSEIIFRSMSDCLQECNETLVQAYLLYRKTEDDGGTSKCVIEIADIYLQYLFEPVILDHVPFDEVRRIPKFESSPISKNEARFEQTKDVKIDTLNQRVEKVKRKVKKNSKNAEKRLTIAVAEHLEDELPVLDVGINFGDWAEFSDSDSGDFPLILTGTTAVMDLQFSSEEDVVIPIKNVPEFDPSQFDQDGWADSWSDEDNNISIPIELEDWGSESDSNETFSSVNPSSFHGDVDKIPLINYIDIELSSIENPATVCRDTCHTFSYLQLMMKCYIVFSELSLLKNDEESAKEYYQLFESHLKLFFLDEEKLFIAGGPPSGLAYFDELLVRACRILFCFDPSYVTKHTIILDSFLYCDWEKYESFIRYIPDFQVIPRNVPLVRKKSKQLFEKKNSTKDSNDVQAELKKRELRVAQKEHGERIWGLLFYQKLQISSYIEGQITLETLVESNKRCIKNIIKTSDLYRTHDIQKIKDNNSLMFQKNRISNIRRISMNVNQASSLKRAIGGSAIDPSLIRASVRFRRGAIYCLKLNDRIVCYSQETGSITGTKYVYGHLNFDERKLKTDHMFCKFKLVNSSESCLIKFPVKTVIKDVMYYLLNGKIQLTKKSRSLTKRNKMSLPQLISQTGLFNSVLKSFGVSNDLPLIVLSKTGGNQMIPIEQFQDNFLMDFFSKVTINSSDEDPIEITIHPKDSPLEGLSFTADEMRYFYSMFQGKLSNITENNDFVSDFKKNFSFFAETADSLLELQNPKDEILYPIILIASRELQFLPWELLTTPLIRSFYKRSISESFSSKRLSTIIDTSDKTKLKEPNKNFMFTFVSFANILETKEERLYRKEKLEENVFSSFYHKQKPVYDGQFKAIFPFHTNPSKKKLGTKSRFLTIVDTSEMDIDDIDFLPISIKNPVLVLTYLDLFEMSEVILRLKNSSTTMIFVPRSHIRNLISKLCTIQGKGADKGKQGDHSSYIALINKIDQFREKENVPVTVFNPPLM